MRALALCTLSFQTCDSRGGSSAGSQLQQPAKQASTEMERITDFSDVPGTDIKLAAARERLDVLEKQMSMRPPSSQTHSNVSQNLRKEERSSESQAMGPDSDRTGYADAETVTATPDRPWAQALIIAQVRSLRCCRL